MSLPIDASHPVWAERAPLALWPALVTLAAFVTTVDASWWASYARTKDSQPMALPASAPVAKPEPMAVAPVIDAQPAAPAPPRPQVADKQPAEARDCPPLFPITFGLNGTEPHFDQAALLALVAWLRDHPQSNLVIDGHADSSGSMATNLAISQRRASAVTNRFVAADLPRERITRRAFGAYNPLVGAPDQAAENRRVVLSITGAALCPTSESQ